MKKLFKLITVHTFFDGEPTPTPTPEPTPTPTPQPENRTYTQAEFTTLIEAERNRHQEQTKTTIKSLEEAKRSASLTAKDKEELQKRISELDATLHTKEELARKEKERIEGQFKTEKEVLAAERDTWKLRYVESQVNSSIISAAVEGDAFNPDFFLALLGPKAELVEIMDSEGKATGKFKTVIKLEEFDKDGLPKPMMLTPAEAVKTLKDKPDRFGNLFKSNVTGGLGGGPSAGNVTTADIKNMDHETYLKHRDRFRNG